MGCKGRRSSLPPQPRCSPLGLAPLPGARLQCTSTWGHAVPAVRPPSVGFPGQHVLRGIIRELVALQGLSSPERRVLMDGLPREPPAVSAAPIGLGSSRRGRVAPATRASEHPQLPAPPLRWLQPPRGCLRSSLLGPLCPPHGLPAKSPAFLGAGNTQWVKLSCSSVLATRSTTQ